MAPWTDHLLSLPARWRQAWDRSLRFRLLALGLMPLLLAFPFVIAVLVVAGGERANSLLLSNLHGHLAGSSNYLDQLKGEIRGRVSQLAKSERLTKQLGLDTNPASNRELSQLLGTAAEGSGLDFLLIALADGTVIGSSTGVVRGSRLPDSYAIRQAQIGVANAAYERFDAEQLRAFSPQFPDQARIQFQPATGNATTAETRGLLINAAAHFPLAVNTPDAILVGGILINKNFPLIEHMREIIFPLSTLPGDAEGITAVFIDDVRIAVSRQRQKGERGLGELIRRDVATSVLTHGQTWTGLLPMGEQVHMAGYTAIVDGDGQRIGMIGVGFPYAPYQQAMLWLLGSVAGLLALTMLGLSLIFLRAGRELTQQLTAISDTMSAVGQGRRTARVGPPRRDDELGQLARHFDTLLDTIAQQDAQAQAAQKTIADEASRRRALFEHERDGVVILNSDGSVFEANPKFAAMLGYTPSELLQLRVSDWEANLNPAELSQLLESVGPEGRFFETVARRKDGSTYVAEVSLSRAQWGDKTFVFAMQRDITRRKAVETELATYRQELERLVEQRTKELQDRTEQLDAIFTLSPDGFVSFDAERKVTFVNRAFLRMTGLTQTDVTGVDESAFSSLLERRCMANATFPGVTALRAAQTASPGSPTRDRRQLFELAAPPNRVLEVGLRLSDAVHVSQILYFRDVTHETEVDRMKSEFLTTAAHELRTPMASIYGYTELLRMREFSADQRRQFLETIARQSELMSSIINELLDLARIEARRGKDFSLERLSLQDIVTETVSTYRPPDGHAPPVLSGSDAPLQVRADRRKMQQALLNVLSNAYKYSPDGGEVSIRYRRDSTVSGLPRIGIEVQDRGIGMTSEQLARVCERFYRADTSGQIPGTGLGMSIVKEIVELHGGEVQLASEPGRGTTVTLWLPVS
jgi:PAS domain S-box-containing protein